MNIRHCTRRIAAMLGAAVLLNACGGGGGVDTGGTGAPLSFVRGPISGFGSVIVNAVRFDDSAASIVDDDGNALSRDALRLGMTTEIDADGIVSGATGSSAKATRIRIASEIVGPVQGVDLANQTVFVFGQAVVINSATVFDSTLASRLASLTVGTVIEVYALPDGIPGSYLATRIAPKPDPGSYRLRGVVASLDRDAMRFVIGALTLSYAGLPTDEVPANLANGRIVKLRLAVAPVAGAWTVLRIDDGAVVPSDREDAHVQGLVTALVSPTRFFVDGVEVDASGADFEDGAIALGLRVEVEGALVGGVLVADKVEIEDESESREVELSGSITTVNAAAQTFVLRGETVRYDGNVRFDDGTAANLLPGAMVEVRGSLAPGGTEVLATRIKFDN